MFWDKAAGVYDIFVNSDSDLKRTVEYYGVIVLFAIGAGIGGKLSELFGQHMIWVSCMLLFEAFCLMESDEKHHLKRKKGNQKK